MFKDVDPIACLLPILGLTDLTVQSLSPIAQVDTDSRRMPDTKLGVRRER